MVPKQKERLVSALDCLLRCTISPNALLRAAIFGRFPVGSSLLDMLALARAASPPIFGSCLITPDAQILFAYVLDELLAVGSWFGGTAREWISQIHLAEFRRVPEAAGVVFLHFLCLERTTFEAFDCLPC